MKNIVLFDDELRNQLLPLTYTRPCALMRVGILTLANKWEKLSNFEYSFECPEYLSKKYLKKEDANSIFINGRIIATDALWAVISNLKPKEKLVKDGITIAYTPTSKEEIECNIKINFINHPDDIFAKNAEEIINDLKLLNPPLLKAKKGIRIIGNNPVYAEKGIWIEDVTLNTTEGPIYLGENSTIMEGSNLRGPFAICNNSQVKMSTKIYPGTTVGPWCKVGGEVNNVVFFGYSNKGHDGFLGNSVIGEWCNIGADSNISNLKNNYDQVRLWDYTMESFRKTGKQFCGLILGDHSKCGINTMFNTGTVVGVSANIYGGGFPRNFIPSYSWGGAAGFTTYMLQKVLTTTKLVMKRRNIELEQIDIDILTHIFEQTKKYRNDK